MEIEARGVEGQVIGVAVGGFEVTGGVEGGRVPEAAAEVGEEREVRPQLGDLADEDGVLVYRPESVVQAVLLPLYPPRRSVYAQLRLRLIHGFLELPPNSLPLCVSWFSAASRFVEDTDVRKPLKTEKPDFLVPKAVFEARDVIRHVAFVL